MTNCLPGHFGPLPRRSTRQVRIGKVLVGGDAPVVVQSMTNTDTADVASTTKQVAELWRAGSELVRVTVNTPEAAAAVPRIVDKLAMMGVEVPIIGDFHYNGHQLLANEPACAEALAKYRINPGNVGFGKKRDTQFAQLVEFAIKHGKPVSTARWAESSAERINASRSTRPASQGSARCAFSSIKVAASDWSSDPQLAPMRTGLSYWIANSINCANWVSRFLPKPTLPGLMRYFASASAQAGSFASNWCPL